MTVTSIFNLVALLVMLAAAFGYANHRWLRLPHTIGLVVIALVVSIVVLITDELIPTLGLATTVRGLLTDVEFEDVLMKALLSFLLFAGALHVDLDALLQRRLVIGVMATLGVITSTVIVAALMYLVFEFFGVPMGFSYCLVFGALISPTDPIAVMGILKEVRVPQMLETKIAGESLFNDGVGVVLFSILVTLASGGTDTVDLVDVASLFALEAVGGIGLGLGAGYVAYRAMRAIDQHSLEVLITLALVMGTYSDASRLHMSGPLAVVVAGLFVGNLDLA